MSNAKFIASLLLIPMLLTSGTSLAQTLPPEESAPNFTDVKEGNFYYVAISYLKQQNIISGYDDNTFKPSQEINRAEALKMLTVTSGLFSDSEDSLTTPETPPFNDTPLDAWYTKYISAAKDKGVVNGNPDGNFKPETSINLAEALKIYLEARNAAGDTIDYTGVEETMFDDTAPGEWYTKYTSYAGHNNLINIYYSNTINPTQALTRGYLAEIIYRTLKHKEGSEFGKATFYQGRSLKSGDSFDTDMFTTAHKTLPFGTILTVTNLANGKSVLVKVTDRGPYPPGRVIDLSKNAFSVLASPSVGVINVEYKIAEYTL